MSKFKGFLLVVLVLVAGATKGKIQVVNYVDILDEISTAFREGNSKDVSKHFASSVSMTLLQDNDLYSKVQAEIILRDFFNKNTPLECKTVNRIDHNSNFKFVVMNLLTSKDNFKVSCKIIYEGNVFKISELKIEKAE